MVYLRLRTVSITLTSKVLDVLDVLDVAGGGGGSDLPPVGISPPKIEVDSAHMSASAIANRFMDVAPFEVEKMPRFLHKKERSLIGTTTQDFLQGAPERITIPLHSLNFSLIESLNSHADDLIEAGYVSPDRESSSRSPMPHCVRVKGQKRI